MISSNRFFVVSLLALVVTVCCACSDGDDLNPPFPLDVGRWWLYEVSSTVSPHRMMVTVRVVAPAPETTRQPAPEAIWQVVWPDHADTSFVFVSDDTVMFQPQGSGNRIWEYTRLVFPLVIGREWLGDYGDEATATRVVDRRAITVSAGTFPDAYRLVWSAGPCCNTYLRTSTWIVPEVGIVKYERWLYDLGFTETMTWDLVAFGPR